MRASVNSPGHGFRGSHLQAWAPESATAAAPPPGIQLLRQTCGVAVGRLWREVLSIRQGNPGQAMAGIHFGRIMPAAIRAAIPLLTKRVENAINRFCIPATTTPFPRLIA